MSEIQSNIEPIRIETNMSGLILSQMITADDDKAYLELQNANVDFWKEFGNSIDETEDAVSERRLENGNGRFGIWADDWLVGTVEYSTKGHENEAEVGIMLDKAATGHGYATVALQAITAFAKPRFDRVYAEVAPDNEDSIALLKRAGYHTTGQIVERNWGPSDSALTPALVFEV